MTWQSDTAAQGNIF